MHDCQEILDELGHCRVYSAMDLKAGFLNVPIHPDWQKYAGLVTQDGLYVMKRMVFGFKTAPCHFQALMEYILRGKPSARRINHGTYLDDITVGALAIPECWQDTLEALRRLTSAGLPISIDKC